MFRQMLGAFVRSAVANDADAIVKVLWPAFRYSGHVSTAVVTIAVM